jgi:hypothetical protein
MPVVVISVVIRPSIVGVSDLGMWMLFVDFVNSSTKAVLASCLTGLNVTASGSSFVFTSCHHATSLS